MLRLSKLRDEHGGYETYQRQGCDDQYERQANFRNFDR